MKLKGKALLSLLLVLALFTQLFAVSASAEGLVGGWESLVFTPFATDEYGQAQLLTGDTAYLVDYGSYSATLGGMPLSDSPNGLTTGQLMNADLRITPPDGFLVAQVWLYGDPGGSTVPLTLTAADPGSDPTPAAVIVKSDVFIERMNYGTPVFRDGACSSYSSSGLYALGVLFARRDPNDNGAVQMWDGSVVGYGSASLGGAPYDDPNAVFAGWQVQYGNGASVLVPAYATVYPCASCTVNAIYAPKVILKPADLTVPEGTDASSVPYSLQQEVYNLPGDLALEDVSMSVDSYGPLSPGVYTLRVDNARLVEAYTGKAVDASRAVLETQTGTLTVEASAPQLTDVTVTVQDQVLTANGMAQEISQYAYSVSTGDSFPVSLGIYDAWGNYLGTSVTDPGVYTIGANVTYDSNLYNVSVVNGTLTVNAPQLTDVTVTVQDQVLTANGTAQEISQYAYSISTGDSFPVSLGVYDAWGNYLGTSVTDPGVYTIGANVTYDANLYSVSVVNGTLTVNEPEPTEVTVTVQDQVLTANGTAQNIDPNAYGVSGLLGSDTVTVDLRILDAWGQDLGDTVTEPGVYTITADCGNYDAAMYSVSVVSGTLTVNAPQLTDVTVTVQDQVLTADGTAQEIDQTAYSVSTGDSFPVSLGIYDAWGNYLGTSVTDPGVYTIGANVTYDSNLYSVSVVSGTLTVNAPQLTDVTVTVRDQVWTADWTAHELDQTAYSVSTGESFPVSLGIYDAWGNYLGTSVTDPGVYTIGAGVTYDFNLYNVNVVNGTLTVNAPDAIPVTVTVQDQTWAADGTARSIDPTAYSVSGLRDGDTVIVDLRVLDAWGQDLGETVTDPGVYTITADCGDYDTAKYSISVTDGTLTVDAPAIVPLTVTVQDQSWTADWTAHSINPDAYSISGLRDGDSATVTLGVCDLNGNPLGTSVTDAGTYYITAVVDYDTARYSINVVNGILTVGDPAAVPVTVYVADQAWTADWTVHSIDPTAYSVSGLLDGDSVAVILGLYDAYGQYIGGAVTDAGSYVIGANVSYDANKYTVTVMNGTLTVGAPDAIPVTVTVQDQSWTADWSTHDIDPNAYSVSGLRDGDTVTVTLGVYDARGQFLGTSVTDAGSYIISANVAYDSAKYTVSVVNGSLTVSAPDAIPVTVPVQDQSWTADGTAKALDPAAWTVTGLRDGDTVSVYLGIYDVQGHYYGNSVTDAGTYVIGAGVNGYDANKYTVTVVNGSLVVGAAPTPPSPVVPVPAELTYNGRNLGKAYDGQPYDLSSYASLEPGMLASIHLEQGGQRISQAVNPGIYDIFLDSLTPLNTYADGYRITVYNSDGSPVSTDYRNTSVKVGLLTITPIDVTPVTIALQDQGWYYDGQPHSLYAGAYSVQGLRGGDQINVSLHAYDANGNLAEPIVYAGIYTIKADVSGIDPNRYSITFANTAYLYVQPYKLTITADTAAKAYDGSPLTSWVTYNALLNGHRFDERGGLLTAVYDSRGSQISGDPVAIGTYTKKVTDVRILDAAGNNVTANYEITKVDGTLTINAPFAYGLVEDTAAGPVVKQWPRNSADNLVFNINADYSKFLNVVKIDGTQLSPSYYSAAAGSTVLTVSTYYLQTLAEGYHSIEVPFTDGTFSRTFVVSAPVAVTPVPITITGRNVSKAYDGNPYDLNSYGQNSQGISSVFHLVQNGQRVSQAVNPGSYDIYLDQLTLPASTQGYRVTIVDSNGSTVSTDYRNTSVRIGTLTITGQNITPVTITVRDQAWTYDGQPHTLDARAYTVTGLQGSDTINVRLTAIDASGRAVSSVINAGTYTIKAEYSGVPGGRYNVTVTNQGTLTVSPYKLTLTAESASKPYDGTPLKNTNVKATSLLNGHSFRSGDGVKFSVYDSKGNLIQNGPINEGSYTKKVTDVHIVDSNGNDVTANYDITRLNGTLTITPGSGSPKTGDRNNLSLWVGLLLASAVLIATVALVLVLRARKTRKAARVSADTERTRRF